MHFFVLYKFRMERRKSSCANLVYNYFLQRLILESRSMGSSTIICNYIFDGLDFQTQEYRSKMYLTSETTEIFWPQPASMASMASTATTIIWLKCRLSQSLETRKEISHNHATSIVYIFGTFIKFEF